MIFGRRKNGNRSRPEIADSKRLAADGKLIEAIDLLSEANRTVRDLDLEIEIRRLRNRAGLELIANAPSGVDYVKANVDPPDVDPISRCPEVEADQLTAELLRSAILRDGCLLVRGLMDSEKALQIAADIDRSFEIRESLANGADDPNGFYDEFDPEPAFGMGERLWVEKGGGVLAVDSPRIIFEMFESFEEAGLRQVITAYLGEAPAISCQKCTLRKATPDVLGAWHQDGEFLGDVRSLNVWVSLSRCGDVAPGMDVVPKRLNEYVAVGGEGTEVPFQIGENEAREAATGVGIVRPIFSPGDALLFDHLFLHQTGSDPEMPNPRYAVECWFFGPSAYPRQYAPIAF